MLQLLASVADDVPTDGTPHARAQPTPPVTGAGHLLRQRGRRGDGHLHRQRRAAGHPPRPATPRCPVCSGRSTRTPWCWPASWCWPGPPPTGSGAGGSSRSAWPSSGSARCCAAWRRASAGWSRRGRCRPSAARCSTRWRWRSSPPRSPTAPNGPGPSACSARCPAWRWRWARSSAAPWSTASAGASIFWINVPIVVAAIVCTALFVPESRAARARRFDPVGQLLVILVLGSVVYAIIESGSLGWTSPLILGLLAVAVLGVVGILGYEPRRADPLLELRLFRSVPFSAAILMALFGLVRVRRVPVRHHPVPAGRARHVGAGGRAVPAPGRGADRGALPAHRPAGRRARSPAAAGGLRGRAGPGRRRVDSGSGRPPRCRPCSAIYLLFGIFLGTINPPITNTAVSGMPRLDGRAGRLVGLRRPADRHHAGRRDRRDDRGIRAGPRRDGVHRRGARRVVAGARARRRHPGARRAQHRALGRGTAARAAALFARVDA